MVVTIDLYVLGSSPVQRLRKDRDCCALASYSSAVLCTSVYKGGIEVWSAASMDRAVLDSCTLLYAGNVHTVVRVTSAYIAPHRCPDTWIVAMDIRQAMIDFAFRQKKSLCDLQSARQCQRRVHEGCSVLDRL